MKLFTKEMFARRLKYKRWGKRFDQLTQELRCDEVVASLLVQAKVTEHIKQERNIIGFKPRKVLGQKVLGVVREGPSPQSIQTLIKKHYGLICDYVHQDCDVCLIWDDDGRNPQLFIAGDAVPNMVTHIDLE
jgi:hypothetical protein